MMIRSSAEKLTDRETEVLTLIAQGQNNKDIAAKLMLSEGTRAQLRQHHQ